MLKVFLIAITLLTLNCLVYSDIVPNGGKDGVFWIKGDYAPIAWDTANVSPNTKLKIELWNAELQKKYLISDSISNSQNQYYYLIPDSIPIGKRYKVIVSVCGITQSSVISKTFFEIYPTNYFSKASNKEVKVASLKEVSIKVFPNPAKNLLNLDMNMNSEYKAIITNSAGEVYANKSFIGNFTNVDISSWSNGLYLIRIENLRTGKSYLEKFLKND